MIGLLRIRNLAVIEALEIEFGEGLNVITGETGAGKTMLVAALELLRGGRAGGHLVRTGEESATIEALLEEDGKQTVIKRVITQTGRSRAYIDDELCTNAELKIRAAQWLDISSQHEHHTLADAASHLGWLDRFAGQESQRHRVAEAVRLAAAGQQALDAFVERSRDADERQDLLRFQAAEIERIAPKPGELDALLAELHTAENAATLVSHTQEAASLLLERQRSAVELCGMAAAALRRAVPHDATLASPLERLESARLELEDLADELARYAERRDVEPERVEQLQAREKELSRLVRRHGSLEAAIERLEALQVALDELEDVESTADRLRTEARKQLESAARIARELSKARQDHATSLAAAVSAELAALGMGDARIEVTVDAIHAGDGVLEVDGARLGPNGLDRVEFLIAPNPGELPRPLARIASGGELSRALLALKQVLSGLGPVSTYVFDEVDTGVGGAVAEGIGRKLHQVARHHQVLCITHQAVIAAWADQHHHVHKVVDQGRTRTRIRTLDRAERQEELARMLGGAEVTAGVRSAAADLLEGARL